MQEVSGRCAGNSDPAADVACGGGLVRAHGVVFGTDEAACCVSEVTGKCTGNSDRSADVICMEGFHPKPGAVDVVDANSCCEADIVGMCTGNTDKSKDFFRAKSLIVRRRKRNTTKARITRFTVGALFVVRGGTDCKDGDR